MKIFSEQKPLSFNFDEKLATEIISPFGFREYDARWEYPDDVNQKGLEIFGYSLGEYISRRIKKGASVVVGHDYRSCLLYTSPSPRDGLLSRMPSSA